MTKAELLAAIAGAPDDAVVFIHVDEVLRTSITVKAQEDEIILGFHEIEPLSTEPSTEMVDNSPPSFKCPQCQAVSYNPNDIRERYCARCHDFV